MVKITSQVVMMLTLSSSFIYAQCSDAGVCVVGSRHALLGHRLSVDYAFGKSGKTDDLAVHSIRVEGEFQILRDSRLTFLLPWSRTTGPLGHVSGIGDLTVLWNQNVLETGDNQLNLQIGGKFATGKTNSGGLPQAYQPGLGTNDFLLGISYEAGPLLFALGYQLSRGRSDNSVTLLQRGDDLLARIGYKAHVDDLVIGLEMLTIKRLQESSVLNPTMPGGNSFIAVPGSDQFQANLLGSMWLPVSESYSLAGFAAVPLRGRSINVDGLTRSITLSIGVQYSF